MTPMTEGLEWLHVSDEEQVEWIGHPSFYPTAGVLIGFGMISVVCIVISFLIAAGSLAVGIPPVFSLVPLGFVGLLLLGGIWKYYEWKSTFYALTSGEIYKKRGIIGRDVTQVGYSEVQNTKYSQSVIERILSFSDISIYTAGTDMTEIKLHNTPTPSKIQEMITNHTKHSSEGGPSSNASGGDNSGSSGGSTSEADGDSSNQDESEHGVDEEYIPSSVVE